MNVSNKKHVLGVRTGPSTKHVLFETWRSMVRRCTDPACDPWGYYYAKGIRVYPLWTTRWERGESTKGWAPGFKQFLNCVEDLCGERPMGYTLDRINNKGHYEPRNIRWAPQSVQQRNKDPFIQPQKEGTKTGVKWVQYRRNRYTGTFNTKGKQIYCGNYMTAEEAYEAVIRRRIEMGLPIPDK